MAEENKIKLLSFWLNLCRISSLTLGESSITGYIELIFPILVWLNTDSSKMVKLIINANDKSYNSGMFILTKFIGEIGKFQTVNFDTTISDDEVEKILQNICKFLNIGVPEENVVLLESITETP